MKIVKSKKIKRPPVTLVLFDRSNFWYCRYWTGKKTQQIALKTRDFRKAQSLAIEIYNNRQKEKSKGKIIDDIDFHKDIAVPYFKRLEIEREGDGEYKKKLNQYTIQIKPFFDFVDYRNTDTLEEKIVDCFDNLKSQDLAVATIRKYQDILRGMFNKALKNNNIPLDNMPEFPKLRGTFKKRPAYFPKEIKMIVDEFRREETEFSNEVADYIRMLTSAGFRPGVELLKVRKNQIGWIGPNKNIMKVTILENKKGNQHKLTVNPEFVNQTYPNIVKRYPKSNGLDYFFFPNLKDREKLYGRISNNFRRISDKLGLYMKDGVERPMYCLRHSYITKQVNKGKDVNVIAMHSNTSPKMIQEHYQSTSDEALVEQHKKLFS